VSQLGKRLKANGTISAADVNECRKTGDELATETWNRALRFLAIGCVSLCRLLDPDRIVIGGGMAKAGKADLLDPLEKYFVAEHWKLSAPTAKLVLAELGNNAGVIGAAGAAWEEYGA
jgi:glucokinase